MKSVDGLLGSRQNKRGITEDSLSAVTGTNSRAPPGCRLGESYHLCPVCISGCKNSRPPLNITGGRSHILRCKGAPGWCHTPHTDARRRLPPDAPRHQGYNRYLFIFFSSTPKTHEETDGVAAFMSRTPPPCLLAVRLLACRE